MDLKKFFIVIFYLLLLFFSDRKRIIFQTRKFEHNLKKLVKLWIHVCTA